MSEILIRPILAGDYDAWLPLWNGYNAFYGRVGPTALSPEITRTTWARFFSPDEPVHALVAQSNAELLGLAHYLYHRSTISIDPVCYLQDLFTTESARGRGVATALIQAVYREAQRAHASRVYWQTHENQRNRAAPLRQARRALRLHRLPPHPLARSHTEYDFTPDQLREHPSTSLRRGSIAANAAEASFLPPHQTLAILSRIEQYR